MTLFSKLKVGDKFIFNGLEYQKVKEQRISCCKIKRNAVSTKDNKEAVIAPGQQVEKVND